MSQDGLLARHARVLVAAALSACVLGAMGTGARAPFVDRQARTFPATPVKPIEIRIPAGTVNVSGEDRHDIAIAVERSLPDEAAASSWPVIAEEEEDHLAVHVLPPPPALASTPVVVTLRAPRATPVRLVDVGEGDLSIRGWRGVLTAKVDRGRIVGENLAGVLRLETSTGDIRLSGFELRREGLLRCRTLTGNISVDLAAPPADARVLLMTMGGRVTTDLPVTDRPGFGGRLKEGLIGNAQPLLSLDAVRGDLTVTLPR